MSVQQGSSAVMGKAQLAMRPPSAKLLISHGSSGEGAPVRAASESCCQALCRIRLASAPQPLIGPGDPAIPPCGMDNLAPAIPAVVRHPHGGRPLPAGHEPPQPGTRWPMGSRWYLDASRTNGRRWAAVRPTGARRPLARPASSGKPIWSRMPRIERMDTTRFGAHPSAESRFGAIRR